MYQDDAVEAFSEYYYRVRAVDAAGQKGPFSDEAAVTTKGREPQITWAGRSRPNRSTRPNMAACWRSTGTRSLPRLDFEALRRRNQGETAGRVVGDRVSRQEDAAGSKASRSSATTEKSSRQKNLQVQLLPARPLENGRRSPRRPAKGHPRHVAAAA